MRSESTFCDLKDDHWNEMEILVDSTQKQKAI